VTIAGETWRKTLRARGGRGVSEAGRGGNARP
jgi:hypothetical protein